MKEMEQFYEEIKTKRGSKKKKGGFKQIWNSDKGRFKRYIKNTMF